METPAEQSKGNDRMNTSESVESAGEEMAEEAKHSNETEGNTEAGAADRQKEQLDIPRDLSYKQIFLSKGNNTLGYKYPLYTRCEFREDFHSITYFDGTVVERPARLTVLRTGQEVFLCPAQRSKAIAKIFVFVGAMATNVKMPPLCLAVLLDKAAYEFRKGINDFQELSFFRACPIKHIGRVPGGGAFEETQPLLVESEPLLRRFFDELNLSGKMLSSVDFVQQTNKNVYTSPSKQKVDTKPQTRGSSRNESKISLERSQEASFVMTPPYARRILDQLAGIRQSLSKIQNVEAPTSRKDKQSATISSKLQKMTEERDRLKQTIKTMQKENSNLLSQISELSSRNADLTAKNAAQAAEIAGLKPTNYGANTSVQMPFVPFYSGMFPPSVPFSSHQQHQVFPYVHPTMNSAIASAQTPPATGPGHVNVHVSNKSRKQKARSRTIRSRSEEYSDSNLQKKRRNERYHTDEYDSESD